MRSDRRRSRSSSGVSLGRAARAARARGRCAHQRLADEHRVDALLLEARAAARPRRCPTPRRRSTPAGIGSQQRSVRPTSTLKSRRSRLLTPIDLARRRRAHARAPRASCTSTSTSSPSARAARAGGELRRARAPPRSAAPRRRPPRAPRAAGTASTMKSLRSTGSAQTARARAQVLERAAEVRLLGEHRQRARAAALVGARRSRRRSAPLAQRRRPTASAA